MKLRATDVVYTAILALIAVILMIQGAEISELRKEIRALEMGAGK